MYVGTSFTWAVYSDRLTSCIWDVRATCPNVMDIRLDPTPPPLPLAEENQNKRRKMAKKSLKSVEWLQALTEITMQVSFLTKFLNLK